MLSITGHQEAVEEWRREMGGRHPALTGRVPGCGPNAPGPSTRGPRETRGFRGVGNTGARVSGVPAKSQISWGWEMARGKGPPRSEDATGRIRGSHEACIVGWIRGSHEACFVGWIGVRDPVILLQRPPKRKAATLP